MSTYRSSTASYTADLARLYDTLSNEHQAVLHGLCSASAATLATEVNLAPPRSVPEVESAWARIDMDLPGWRTYLPAPAAAGLEAARRAPQHLDEALAQVTRALAAQERLLVADVSSAALADLGYAVQRVDGQRTSAIEARRGHETFLVAVEDQGVVTTDHAGLAGDDCNDRQRDYVQAMQRRGVLFGEEVVEQHHDPRGGAQIATAARAGGPSLAHGAVIDGDARPPSLTSGLTRARKAARRQLREGGAR